MGQKSELATVIRDTSPALIGDLLFPHIPGRERAWATVIDISVTSPLTLTNRANPEVPLAPSAECEKRKHTKYDAAAQARGLDFRPVVFESTGALGQSAKDFFSILLSNSCTLPDDPNNGSNYTKLMQAVAVALHRSTGDKFIAARAIHRGRTSNTSYYSLPHHRGHARRMLF